MMKPRQLLFALLVFVFFTTIGMILFVQHFTILHKYTFAHVISNIDYERDEAMQVDTALWKQILQQYPQITVDNLTSILETFSETSRTANASGSRKWVDDSAAKESPPAPPENPIRPLHCKDCFFSGFNILIERPDLCSSSSGVVPELIMIITSSYRGYPQRQAIRTTWASLSEDNTARVRYVFILGTTPEMEVPAEIREESGRHQDMLVSDFVDSYKNLTLKTMVGLRWIVHRCSHAKFFLKTDQDMYVFPHRVLALAWEHEKTLMTSLGGHCTKSAKPCRNSRIKYFASFHSYPQKTYPGFCSGTGYIGTLELARQIVDTSPDIPFFHLEDVYVALVLRHLDYKLTPLPGFAQTMRVCRSRKRLAGKVMTIHQVKPYYMRMIWKQILCKP